MIQIEMWLHGSVIDDSASFEEADIQVTTIGNNEKLEKEDFARLWEAVQDVEVKDLSPENSYKLHFKRTIDDYGFGWQYSQCYFELVKITKST